VTSWLAARRASDSFRSITLIILAVIVANGAFIFFGYESSPIWWTASISSRACAWTCGIPTVDPNVGFITQPLGHLAAMDWLHGHIPWWNYFEGMGQPLAGEMQAAALFPLVVLFVFPAGLMLFHLSLQIITGVCTYFLVRRLGVGPTLATLAGVLFALNGTFAWIGNAAINPVAFLPMLILGIEIVLDRTRHDQRAGWTVMAIAIALSIYAGFPEMAYLDGLLAAGWAITRIFSLERPHRLVALRHLGLGGLVGICLSAPILVSFVDFVKDADIGAHAAHGLSIATTPAHTLPLLVDPYLGGALFGGSSATPNNLLGYFTASVAVFAVVGVVGPRLRPLRWFLLGWVAAVLAGVLNFLEVRHLWNLIPEMGAVGFARYIWPTTEFAVIVLAVLGLSDIVEYTAQRTVAKWAAGGVFAVALAGVALVSPLGGHVRGSLIIAVSAMIILPFVALAVLGYALSYVSGRTFLIMAVAVMTCESMIFFALPTFRSPSSITIATGSIDYLEQHEGLNRFVSLGVLTPNWGTQYGLNEINAVDLPLPTSFTNYINSSLAPSLGNPRLYTLPFTVASEDELAAHIGNYESLGVEYLLVPRKPLAPALLALGLTPLVADAHSELFRIPHAANFYSTALTTCVVSNETVDHVSVDCPSATTLTRLELSMTGWSARVNGVATNITTTNGLNQTIKVPAGMSTVSYEFLPAHEDAAGTLAVVAFFVMAATWLPFTRRRRKNSPVTRPDEGNADATSGDEDDSPDSTLAVVAEPIGSTMIPADRTSGDDGHTTLLDSAAE